VHVTFAVRAGLFVVCCVIAALLQVQLLWALFEFSQSNGTASYVLLMPLVALVLVYQEREIIFREVQTDVLLGAPLIAGGAVLMMSGLADAGRTSGDLSAPVAALVVVWIGAFVLFYGRGAARRAAFPLFFLACTIPIPAAWLAAAVQVLKNGTTEAVALLFTMTGSIYHRDGYVFSLPGVAIEIADECSGIRSSIGLLLTSLMAGHLFLNKGWTRSLLIFAVLPLAILKNAVRIVALTLLSVHVDPGFLTGQLHHEGGFVFFLLALGLMAPVLLLLRGVEAPRTWLSRARVV
jgi:exosortase